MKFDEAILRAKKICSNQEKCCQDIYNKLSEWGIPKEKAEKIINILIENKFIDEERYAKAFVNDKFKFNHWGKIKIKNHLFSKRISEDNINEALKSIDIKKYKDVLRNILQKKKKEIKNTNSYQLSGKLINHAYSKGFEIDISKDIIKEIID